jgi:ABC-type multidrug transport system ATPase subunit
MTLLDARDLAAAYDGRPVFSGVNLDLDPGIYALTGPNGSGKSTLLRLLAGAQRPAQGSIRIAGHDLVRDPVAARRQLSYAPDDSPAYPFMTGSEFLRMVAAAKSTTPGPIVDSLIAAFGLAPFLDQRFDGLSLGTQKKLVLAAAWIGDPRVILLDEPSNALDAASRAALVARAAIDSAKAVILFASHEAEFVAQTKARVLPLERLAQAA